MQINLTNKKGFTLHTANSRVKEDIVVGVETENLDISPTTNVQEFDGLYGKVVVGAIPIETKKILELDFSELESINIIPSQGKYLSLITIDKDSNLLPGNIRKDTKIYGVTGTLISSDSSDATATAGDIVEGKTAYVNNKKITGTVAERSDSFLISGTYFTKVQVSEEAQILALVSGSLTKSYLLRSGTKIETNATYQQVAKAIGLTAEKIAVGNTILGIEGTSSGIDTSDADAVAENILEGKTAYVNSKKITGIMSNNGELNFVPSDEEQEIPKGYTSGGTISKADITTLQDYKICESIADSILTGQEV